jgi:hypothetical protein
MAMFREYVDNLPCNESSDKTPATETRHKAEVVKTKWQLAGGDQKVFPKETSGERLA